MNIIDTHVDTITKLFDINGSIKTNNLNVSTDFLDYYEKKGINFAIWLDKLKRNNAYESTVKIINFYYEQVEKNSTLIHHCNNYDEYEKTFNNGIISSILSLEGGDALEGSIEKFYNLYEMGIRLLTLTWNYDNTLGCGVFGSNKGLTDFGKHIIKLSNDLNMIIDVSHINEKGFFDVIDLTTKPIIATHSNAYYVQNNIRNLKDNQLAEIKNTKSYVSVTLHCPFVNGKNTCTLSDVIKHIDYLLNFLGEDFICIGSDFDGTDEFPSGLTDIKQCHLLYNLIEKTYNTLIADKIFYLNQLNFLQKVL